MRYIKYLPGAQSGNAKVSIPAVVRENKLIRTLISLNVIALVEAAPNTLTSTAKTVVAPTATPGAGNACLDTVRDGIRVGDALTASNWVECILELDFETLRP